MTGKSLATRKQSIPAQWEDAEEFGTGRELVEKEDLIKVPFLIGTVQFNEGDYGPFVSLVAVDIENTEFVFIDGSTGIYAQVVEKLHEAGALKKEEDAPDEGEYEVRWLCRKGLRVSEYEYEDDKGKKRGAKTYYIA